MILGVAPPELNKGLVAVTDVTMLLLRLLICPCALPKATRIESVALKGILAPTLYPVSKVLVMPVTWPAGRLRAVSVVRVLLDVAVMFDAVPVVFWLRTGTSEARIPLNVGAPAKPLGAAKNVLAACDFNVLSVKVPDDVTGLPVMLKMPVLSAKPTLVTVPPLDEELMVMVEAPRAKDMLVPATKVNAPMRPFKLVTAAPGPASSCQYVPFHSYIMPVSWATRTSPMVLPLDGRSKAVSTGDFQLLAP